MEQLGAGSCHLPHPYPTFHFNESHLQGVRQKGWWRIHINMTAIRRLQQLVEGGIRDDEVREGNDRLKE